MNQMVGQYPVQRLAEVFSISRMSMYRSEEPGPRKQENTWLMDETLRVYNQHHKR